MSNILSFAVSLASDFIIIHACGYFVFNFKAFMKSLSSPLIRFSPIYHFSIHSTLKKKVLIMLINMNNENKIPIL